jgi:hypothetical protein
VSPYCTYDLALANVSTCEGDSDVLLDAGAGFSAYLWSDGSTGQTLNATAAGTYMVTVTNAVGCQAGDEVTVSYLPSSSDSLTVGVCPDEQVVVNGTTLTAGQSATFAFTNIFGCDSVVTYTAFAFPAPLVHLGNDTVLTAPASYVLDAGAGQGYIYLWSTGAVTQTITVTQSGTYAVTVINANGCESTDTVQVFITSGTGEQTLAGNLTLFPNPTTGWTSLRFEDFRSGAYTVAVHDLLGRVQVQQRLDLPSGTAVHPLDLSALPSGAYFVRVTDGKGAAVRRVVVE